MSAQRISLREWLLIGGCVLLLIGFGFFFVTWVREGIHTSIVAGRVAMLVEMEDSARSLEQPSKIIESAIAAAGLGKVRGDSSADVILSIVASNTIRNMRLILEDRTGKKFDYDPKEWLKQLSDDTNRKVIN